MLINQPEMIFFSRRCNALFRIINWLLSSIFTKKWTFKLGKIETRIENFNDSLTVPIEKNDLRA